MTLLESPTKHSGRSPAASTILARIADADRFLQRERAGVGLLRAIPWLLAIIPAVFAVDVILHLPPAERLVILVGAILSGVLVLARAAYLAWGRSNSPEHTARVLECRDPQLGSKLMNLLQLGEQASEPALSPFTRELANQATEECAQELLAFDLPALAKTNEVRQQAKHALVALLGIAALLMAAFDVSRTEFPRFLDPFGDHPPYSFTHLEIVEPAAENISVVYGEAQLFTVRATGHRPADVFLSSYPVGHPDQVTKAPMFDKGEHGFSQQIEGIKSDLMVFAQTRNGHSVSKQRRVSVVLTPKLEKAWVKISPPAYTGLVPEERPLQFKSLKALEGSEMQFRLQSNRPLGSGRIELIKSSSDMQTIAMAPSGANEVSGVVTATDSARLRFAMVDRDGHPSEETWELSLNVTHDLPPDVQIVEPPGDSFVAMDFKVNVIAEASDDYGVKALRIHRARNGQWVDPKVTTPGAVTRNLRDTITLDFKQMELEEGDVFSFFAEAIDTAPQEHVARTPVVNLTVITTDDYNNFLRERLDLTDIDAKYSDLFNQLHDLAEEQRKLGEQIDTLKQQMAESKDPAALASKLDALLARQNEENTKLNKLADEMDSFVRDKPLYDVESDFREMLQQKAQQIRESTTSNDQASQKTAQQSSPAKGGRQMNEQMLSDLKKASDAQLEKLGAAEEAAREEVQQPLEDMSKMQKIMEDLNHIEDLLRAQQNLEQQAKAYDRAGALSREDQIALKDLAAAQKQIGDELEAVESKLWEDGEAAQDKFPKAAKSAKAISKQMGDLRLQMQANQATEAMLGGHGATGALLASHLRGDLESLFSTCNSQEGQMSEELDQYLGLKRSSGLKPGNNFKQMMQSRKFGNGKSGFSKGESGPSGKGGATAMMSENAHVLGNETAISHESQRPEAKGLNQQKSAAQKPETSLDQPDVPQGVPAINRESGAIQGESSLEQYGDIVEKYFKAITKPKPSGKDGAAHPSSNSP